MQCLIAAFGTKSSKDLQVALRVAVLCDACIFDIGYANDRKEINLYLRKLFFTFLAALSDEIRLSYLPLKEAFELENGLATRAKKQKGYRRVQAKIVLS